MLKRGLFFCFVLTIPNIVLAEPNMVLTEPSCDSVLVKNTTAEKSEDARALASYSLINEETFNQIKNSKGDSSSAGVSYKFFKADFDKSSTYSDFREHRKKRLQEYKYSENESHSRDILREFLTDKQVEGWVACKLANASEGGVVLKVTNKAPTLRVVTLQTDIRFPKGVGSGKLELELAGATFTNEKNKISQRVTGAHSLPFTIIFNKEAEEATLTAKIAGSTDSLHLIFSEKKYLEKPEPQRVSSAYPPFHYLDDPNCYVMVTGKLFILPDLPSLQRFYKYTGQEESKWSVANHHACTRLTPTAFTSRVSKGGGALHILDPNWKVACSSKTDSSVIDGQCKFTTKEEGTTDLTTAEFEALGFSLGSTD